MAARDDVAVAAIVGLGNPGSKYARSRHNAGFLVLAELCPRITDWTAREWWDEARVDLESRELLLVRPLTYMNRSGAAVGPVARERALSPSQILVISDDVTLPWGRVRIRKSGSAGGHRGLESVEQTLGSVEYPRLRVGVSAPPPGVAMADHVLEPLEGEEWDRLCGAIATAVEAVRVICAQSLDAAMNRFNPAPVDRISETRELEDESRADEQDERGTQTRDDDGSS